MYGVADLTPTSKPLQSGEGSSKASHPVPHLEHKKEKSRKKQRDSKLVESGGGQMIHPLPDLPAGKKKASVSPYESSCQTVSSENPLFFSLEKKPTNSSSQLPSRTPTKLHSSSQASVIPTGSSHSAAQQQPTHLQQPSRTTLTATVKGKKKIKKTKRKRSSLVHEIHPNLPSKSVDPTGPLSNRSRPEALSLPVVNVSSTPGHSEGPDTGDVRHMLQELLHPQPVSLVTPIPTPNKVQPFIFPTLPSVSKFPVTGSVYTKVI